MTYPYPSHYYIAICLDGVIYNSMTTTSSKTIKFYCDGDKFYSVDMIMWWIRDTNSTSTSIPLDKLIPQLSHDYWGDPRTGREYSPMDVARSPQDYPEEMLRTQSADLRYPIIIEDDTGYIIDGLHRLLKKYLRGNTVNTINAYRIPRNVLRKFAIGRSWSDIDSLTKRSIRTQYNASMKQLAKSSDS